MPKCKLAIKDRLQASILKHKSAHEWARLIRANVRGKTEQAIVASHVYWNFFGNNPAFSTPAQLLQIVHQDDQVLPEERVIELLMSVGYPLSLARQQGVRPKTSQYNRVICPGCDGKRLLNSFDEPRTEFCLPPFHPCPECRGAGWMKIVDGELHAPTFQRAKALAKSI